MSDLIERDAAVAAVGEVLYGPLPDEDELRVSPCIAALRALPAAQVWVSVEDAVLCARERDATWLPEAAAASLRILAAMGEK